MKSITLVVLCFFCGSKGANILGVVPIPSHSHYILGHVLMRELAERGHNVTYISCFKDKNPPPRNGSYRDVVLTGFLDGLDQRDILNFDEEPMHPISILTKYNLKQLAFAESVLQHENVQNLIHSNESFDVVIMEQFMNEAFKAFAGHYKAHLVLLSTIGANIWTNLLVANPAPTSYIPAVFLNSTDRMTLYERTLNTFVYLFTETTNYFYIYPMHGKIAKKYFPNVDFDNVLYKASLVLLNSHPSINQPVPYVPNMVDVGGLHIKPPQPLPKDLKKFLDEAHEGAIFFSLGSNLRSTELPSEKLEAFLKTFSKLKQKVLWKWEQDVLPNRPNNVKVGKWLPQSDILAHPNVKLFITHGGLLSTTETIYHGTPALAIPIFGDQKMNARKMVQSGYGLLLSYQSITEEALTDKINLLLNDTRFADNARRRAKIFHDRITSPIDTAVYWVEYVIRHNGAPHLKVAALDLPLYQYFLLDVIFVFAVIIYIFYKLATTCLALLHNKPKKFKRH